MAAVRVKSCTVLQFMIKLKNDTKDGAFTVEKVVSYRHNIMQINSLDTFLGVKGGFTNARRDVYFVRALGEDRGFADAICQADKRMGIEMSRNRLWYVRLQSLPQLCKAEDVSFYSGVYEEWKQSGKIRLRQTISSEVLQNVISAGLAEVLAKHRTYKQAVSDSMLRNFAAKILFWTDEALGQALGTWNERSCMKIIAENVTKEQEYLFFYFVTLLGCDVLLLENRKDAEVTEELKNLSQKLVLGQFGTDKLPEYKPYVPEPRQAAAKGTPANIKQEATVKVPVNTVQAADEVRRANVRVTLPERKRHKTQVATAGAQDIFPGNAEKTFEELAQLASSIVMIAVHDSRREVIGTGSGIMIGKAGFILTNDHVVSGGRFFSVRIEDDGQIYTTDEVIKYNYNLDLAVIRISKQLNPLPIYNGTKKLVRGQKVVAIGSPLGLFNSVSDGIISGFRDIRDVNMIQFTAPISPGSSGGAVLNMQGEVIGISTAGIDNGQNINLAVGYEDIRTFARGFY